MIDRFIERNALYSDALRKRYELILTSMGEGVYGVDTEGRTTFVNPAAEEMTGWPESDLIGEVVHLFHHHSHADGSTYPADQCPVYQTARDGQQREIDDEVFWRKDGSCFPVEYIVTALEQDDQIIGAVIVFKDISERRRNERALKDALAQVERLKEQLQADNDYLREELQSQSDFSDIVGQSPAIKQVLTQIDYVAPTDSSVLIQGESGTGKELIARAIHQNSRRRNNPLVRLNCGAIAPNLVESELFGHEQGAFTGANRRRVGRFELANGGTLFLDEVGELPLDIQVKLLRVLQEGEFERLGSSKTIKVDVRVIAATNRDVMAMVEQERFRSDLYYRLNVFPIHAPALRQRMEDLPALCRHILQRLNHRLGKVFESMSEQALSSMQRYTWPGNVRELQNVLERAAITANPPILDVEPLAAQSSSLEQFVPLTMKQAEAEHIKRTLKQTGGVIAGKQGAAELLDLPPSTLRSRMRKLGLL